MRSPHSSSLGEQSSPRQSHVTAPSPRWSDDWGNWAALFLIVMVLSYLFWLPFQWGSDLTVMLIEELSYLPIMTLGIVFALRTSRLPQLSSRTRRAWRIISLSFAFWLLGDIHWSYQEISGSTFGFSMLGDVSYLLFYVFLLIGMLTFAASTPAPGGRTHFWVDTAIIVLGMAILTGYFIIAPAIADMDQVGSELLLFFAYPMSDALILLVAFSVLSRASVAERSTVLLLLVAGMVVIAATDLWWTYLLVRDDYTTGGVPYALWMIGQTLLALSPQRHFDVVRRDVPPANISRFAERTYSAIPYAAAAIAFSVLMVAAASVLYQVIGLLMLPLILLACLVVVRQVTTLRENTRLRVQDALRERQEWFRALVEYSSDMVTVLNCDLRCTFQSPSSSEVIGVAAESLEGRPFLELIHPRDHEHVKQRIFNVLSGELEVTRVEWQLAGNGGHTQYLESVVSDELNNESVQGIVVNTRDVTDRKHLERRLTFQAYHDPLTDLPNRSLIISMLEQTLLRANENRGVGLLFLDLDHFKSINDSLGHGAGDELLIEIADRIRAVLRPTEVLGRLAGDEFTVILDDLSSESEALAVAERVLEHLRRPVVIQGIEARVSASMGVAFSIDSTTGADEMLKRADTAMYAAKRNGRDRVERYDRAMEDDLVLASRDRGLPDNN